MVSVPAAVSRIGQLLAVLARDGYDVQKVAFNSHLTPPPRRSGLTLKFGLRDGDVSAAEIMLEAVIDVRGDLCPGRLSQWRLTRQLPGEGGRPQIVISALMTIEGDVSDHLIQLEGSAALGMTVDVLLDATKTLSGVPSKLGGEGSQHPTTVVNVNVAGDLATGYSGLSPKLTGDEMVTVEGQVAGLAICDLLLNDILPRFRGDYANETLNATAASAAVPGIAVATLASPYPQPHPELSQPTSLSLSGLSAPNAASHINPSNHRGRHAH